MLCSAVLHVRATNNELEHVVNVIVEVPPRLVSPKSLDDVIGSEDILGLYGCSYSGSAPKGARIIAARGFCKRFGCFDVVG